MPQSGESIRKLMIVRVTVTPVDVTVTVVGVTVTPADVKVAKSADC